MLIGLATSSTADVVAADNVLTAIGKLQAKAAAAATALGQKAASGANSDIKSLTGLTTALSVGQGGTGVTTTAALLSALLTAGAYGRANAVGTVSQSGGVPSGAIFEQGSNANGFYTKMMDGTMFCVAKPSGAPTVAANGATQIGPIAMPAEFVDTTFFTLHRGQPQGTYNGFASSTSFVNSRSTATVVFLNGPTAQPVANIMIFAEGRWF